MKWDLVIFDLDGTVLDTIQDLNTAANYSFALHRLPQRTVEGFKQLVGNGVRMLMYNALPSDLRDDPDYLNDCINKFTGYYKDHLLESTKPYDGMPELVDELLDAGIQVAIASNKFQSGVEKLIHHFYPRIEIIQGDVPGLTLKPDPAMVNMVIEQASSRGNVRRDRCVLVGDAASDIQAAASAGIAGIGVSWGLRPVSALLAAGLPQALIADTPAQLRDMLFGQLPDYGRLGSPK